MSNESKDYGLVSVLMPAYNHQRFVTQAIQSVWAQTYKNIELVVIDDGSRDETFRLLKTLQEKSPIPFKLFTQSNQGVCKTLNRCVGMAEGKWLATLASDDFYREDFIQTMVDTISAGSDPAPVLHCDAQSVDENGKLGERLGAIKKLPPLTGKAFYQIAFGKGFIISSTMFLPKSHLDHVGGFDDSLRAEDFDVHLRLARFFQFQFVDKPMFYSRKVSGSLGSRIELWSEDIFTALEKHRVYMQANFQTVVDFRHRRLAIGFMQDLNFSKALEHLFRIRQGQSVASLTINRAGLLIRLLLCLPRALAIRYLPKSAITKARRLKHQFTSRKYS